MRTQNNIFDPTLKFSLKMSVSNVNMCSILTKGSTCRKNKK